MTDVRIHRAPATESIEGLVYKTFLKSFRPFARWIQWDMSPTGPRPRASYMESGVYFREQHKLIESCLSRGQLWLASDAEVEDAVWGWALAEGPVLHYVYVKDAFRRVGVASRLVAAIAPREFSHWTAEGWALLSHCPGVLYNPYRSFQQGVSSESASAGPEAAAAPE